MIMNELESILKSFYEISGMNMTIFDMNHNVIASFPKHKSPFCSLLDKNINAKQNCIYCDEQAMKHVHKTGSIYIYRCWCGLYEAIMPLYTYGQLSGYLMMGQILDKDKDINEILDCISKYISINDSVSQTLKQTSSLTKKQIKAYGDLIDLYAKYLTLTNSVVVDSKDLAEEIQSYLVHHYTEDITIEYLCSYFHVSKGTLHSHFKEKYHTTIHQRLLSIRLEKARTLLTSTNDSIKMIAKEVGFQDADYFSKTFKKRFQVSASNLKKEYTK